MLEGNDNNRKLYVGTLDGVCTVSSSDAGESWEQGQVTMLTNAAARLSVSATQPGRAYLAAYEAGVFRTDDGGNAWRHLSSYPTAYAHSVLVHPIRPESLFVGSEPAAVFRSDDGGNSWDECQGLGDVPEAGQWNFHGDRLSHVRELRTVPGDPNVMYAGIEVGGVVRSRDGGQSWKQLEGTNDDIHFVNISGADPSRVYLATAEAPYRSDDWGDNWESINDGLERSYTLHIAASPYDADLVLVAVSANAGRDNPQFYRSINGGRNWTLIESIGNADDMVVALDWDPTNQGQVYAATDHGNIFCSHDGGQQWEQLPVEFPAIAIGALVVA